MQIKKQYKTPERLVELVKNIKKMHESIGNDAPCASLSEVGWVYPISILPLVVYAHNNGISITYTGNNEDVSLYLDSIGFPSGVTNLFDADSNYLPITKMSCGISNPLLNEYEERILSNISEKYRNSFMNGLKFLTSELQNNVEEHSSIDNYWIFAQYWDRTKTCEICIADTGIGYKNSYKGTAYEVDNHFDAIRNALKGLSSKPVNERGCGLSGIMKMFIAGYKGELVIMSGNGLLYAYQKKNIMYECPISWNGAFVGLKFRLKEIDVSKYY
ncbi:MAG: hypothetical protein JXA98_02295 [Methanosarcinaceae archaeon]|nr:hypothetical protein [Methanosarcinaceae archaeon]